MTKTLILISTFALLITGKINAQAFSNPDLDGDIRIGGDTPFNWRQVPFNDPNCLAEHFDQATSDLTNLTMPPSLGGIQGQAYSGTNFVSGLMGIRGDGAIFHEGIMQTVIGFTPNEEYGISFYQANVKQYNCLDNSGAWMVIVDNNIVGITTPTFSTDSFNHPTFLWEKRKIVFTATAVLHTIKFLPYDNDDELLMSQFDNNGAIRMGIDNIHLTTCNPPSFDLGQDTALCSSEALTLDAFITGGENFLWQDSSTNTTLSAKEEGTYWVKFTVDGCSVSDTITIFEDVEAIVEIPTIFTPNGDSINDLFKPIILEKIKNIDLSIFSRWGKLVYENTGPSWSWNGTTTQGDNCSEGIYYYILNYVDNCDNKRKTIKGALILMR